MVFALPSTERGKIESSEQKTAPPGRGLHGIGSIVGLGHFAGTVSIFGIETYKMGISPSSEVKYGMW